MRDSKQQSDGRAACSTAGTSTCSSPVPSRLLAPQQLSAAAVQTHHQEFYSTAAGTQDAGHGLYAPQHAAANVQACLDGSSSHVCDDHHLGCDYGSVDSATSQPSASISGRDRHSSPGSGVISGSDQHFRIESDSMHHADNVQQAGAVAADSSATVSSSISRSNNVSGSISTTRSSISSDSSDHQRANCTASPSQLGPLVEEQDHLIASTMQCGCDEDISVAAESTRSRHTCEHSLIVAVSDHTMAPEPKVKAAVCTLPACKDTTPSHQNRCAAAPSSDAGGDSASASVSVLAPTDGQAAPSVQLTMPLPMSLSDVPEQAMSQPALLEADEGSPHCNQEANHIVLSVNDPVPPHSKLCNDIEPLDDGLETKLHVNQRLQYVSQLLDVCKANVSLKELLLSDAITFDNEADESMQHLCASILG